MDACHLFKTVASCCIRQRFHAMLLAYTRPSWYIFVILCPTLLLTSSSVDDFLPVQKRIINGYKADVAEFPWAASMKCVSPNQRSTIYCGATIINETWLLTAAHCFNNWGSGDLYYEKQLADILHVHIKEIVFHPNYTHGELEYDIALVKLNAPLPLSSGRLSAVKLPPSTEIDKWPEPNTHGTFVGWGCLKSNGKPSSHAHVVALKVLPNDICDFLYEFGADLNAEHEFCAGYYKSNVGICSGDSGSGLIHLHTDNKPYIVGVASATHADEPGNFPGIFTRVAYFTDWIKTTIDASIEGKESSIESVQV